MEEIKPRLRGSIHYIAFLVTGIFTVINMPLWVFLKFDYAMAIYLLVQLLQFGISSTYHRTEWKSEKSRRLFQRLDHASIFLLIAGTQTSVALLNFPILRAINQFIITTWTISSVGILKVIILETIWETLDIIVYILHGFSVLPYFRRIAQNFSNIEVVFFAAGAFFYVTGAILFRIRKPNISPKVFGYHEVWHVFTILANLCYFIPITKSYFQKIYREFKKRS